MLKFNICQLNCQLYCQKWEEIEFNRQRGHRIDRDGSLTARDKEFEERLEALEKRK